MKIEVAPNLTDEQQRILKEMDASWAEEDRLQREGKLKPWSKHMQDKMNSGGLLSWMKATSLPPPKPTDTTE